MPLTKAHNRMIDSALVNVKDFGAVGGGVAYDTSAIQAAVNSLDTTNTPLLDYRVVSPTITGDKRWH